MNIGKSLQSTKNLVVESTALLLKHPWLMLYRIVPSFIVNFFILADLAQKNLIESPIFLKELPIPTIPYFADIELTAAIMTFAAAAGVLQTIGIITRKRIDFKELVTNPMWFALILLILVDSGVIYLSGKLDTWIFMHKEDPYSSPLINPMTIKYVFQGLKFIWKLLSPFVLALIVIKKASIIRAFKDLAGIIRSSSLELIIGGAALKIFLAFVSLPFLLCKTPIWHFLCARPIMAGFGFIWYVFAILICLKRERT